MRRTLSILVAVVATFALASVAFAAKPQPSSTGSPHYMSGPTFSISGDTVTATGNIAGLGSDSVDVSLSVTASQEVQCTNRGGNIAPGQTQTFSDSSTQSDLRPENGRLAFSISATADPSGNNLNGACPNGSWTAIPGDVTVTSATLTVSRGSTILFMDTTTF